MRRDPTIDFQPRRPGLLSIALFFAAGLLCFDAWLDWKIRSERVADLRDQIAHVEKRAAQLNRSRNSASSESKLPADQGKALQQAVTSVQTDWEALYRHIDRASNEDLALLTITPNLTAHTVLLAGEARSLPNVLAFIDALRQPPLSQVSLLSHKIKADDPQRPVSFEITANWNPAQ